MEQPGIATTSGSKDSTVHVIGGKEHTLFLLYVKLYDAEIHLYIFYTNTKSLSRMFYISGKNTDFFFKRNASRTTH